MLEAMGLMGFIMFVTGMGTVTAIFFSTYCFIGEHEAIILLVLLFGVVILWITLYNKIRKR